MKRIEAELTDEEYHVLVDLLTGHPHPINTEDAATLRVLKTKLIRKEIDDVHRRGDGSP